ncbi:MAG: nucleotidyltransferase family protein [Pseudomonadota bacterium]
MRNDPTAVMIFAAGFGTRMGDLTKDRPKPLIEVAGRPLIDHALSVVDGFGADKVVINLHYKAELLRAHLAGKDVAFSEERPDILETGGGLKAALPLLGGEVVFTMNSDAVWAGPNPLRHLLGFWDPDKMDALLLCVPRDHAIGHDGTGDFLLDPQGRMSRGAGQVYSGVQIIKTDRVQDTAKAAFSLNEVWDVALAKGRLFGASYPGTWCDVGHPEGICLAEAMLNA